MASWLLGESIQIAIWKPGNLVTLRLSNLPLVLVVFPKKDLIALTSLTLPNNDSLRTLDVKVHLVSVR
jgi:hypothetical protein